MADGLMSWQVLLSGSGPVTTFSIGGKDSGVASCPHGMVNACPALFRMGQALCFVVISVAVGIASATSFGVSMNNEVTQKYGHATLGKIIFRAVLSVSCRSTMRIFGFL